MAVAVAPVRNQLLVLCEGTGTLDLVDLTSYAVVQRIDAGETEREGEFTMPLISSITPSSASAGSTFTLTVTGSGFQTVQGMEFVFANGGMGMGGGMMGGGSIAGMGQTDPNIKVSTVRTNAAGTQITASVQILSGAALGTRQVRLQTTYGSVMGMMTNTLFTVNK
jgi:hypothetical protein